MGLCSFFLTHETSNKAIHVGAAPHHKNTMLKISFKRTQLQHHPMIIMTLRIISQFINVVLYLKQTTALDLKFQKLLCTIFLLSGKLIKDCMLFLFYVIIYKKKNDFFYNKVPSWYIYSFYLQTFIKCY